MRSKTYGDKQREAQQRKKLEELRTKSNPKAPPAAGSDGETPSPDPGVAENASAESDSPDKDSKEKKKKDPRGRRSA